MTAESDVPTQPAKPPVAETLQVFDQRLQGLRLVAQDRMAQAGMAGRDGDSAQTKAAQLVEKAPGDFADQHDALKRVSGSENAAELFRIELILGAEKDGRELARFDLGVQPML